MNPSMFRFHPVRFFELRRSPLWSQAVRNHMEAVKRDRVMALIGVGESIMFQHEEYGGFIKPGIEAMQFPNDRLNRAFDHVHGEAATILETAIKGWAAAGEHIFDASLISAMFLESDVSEMPVNELKLPYSAFYLYWGPHLAVPSPHAGRWIDGCYVERCSISDPASPTLKLTFTCSLADGDPWQDRSLLANIVVDAEGAFDCDTGFFTEGGRHTIGAVVSEVLDGDTYDVGAVETWRPYVKAAVTMAVNCICYVTSKQAEIAKSFPDGAPPRLVKESFEGNAQKRVRSRSKLNAMGFRMINICGKTLASRLGMTPGCRTMPAHWRRGHWHKVRFGVRWSEVRVEWREGTLVNASQGDPEGGRIYKKAA